MNLSHSQSCKLAHVKHTWIECWVWDLHTISTNLCFKSNHFKFCLFVKVWLFRYNQQDRYLQWQKQKNYNVGDLRWLHWPPGSSYEPWRVWICAWHLSPWLERVLPDCSSTVHERNGVQVDTALDCHYGWGLRICNLNLRIILDLDRQNCINHGACRIAHFFF